MGKLEQADEALLRRILECPSSTPKEMMYLELNCLPIRFIIMSRRLNYLSTILKENEDSLLFKFFQAQLKTPNKNDWALTVQKDMEYLDINVPMSEISKMSGEKLINTVKMAVRREALDYLNREKINILKYCTFSMLSWNFRTTFVRMK